MLQNWEWGQFIHVSMQVAATIWDCVQCSSDKLFYEHRSIIITSNYSSVTVRCHGGVRRATPRTQAAAAAAIVTADSAAVTAAAVAVHGC